MITKENVTSALNEKYQYLALERIGKLKETKEIVDEYGGRTTLYLLKTPCGQAFKLKAYRHCIKCQLSFSLR